MPNRKFSGLRAALEKAKNDTSPAERAEARNGKGKAPGKRSNPAWTQHTVMLEKETHRAALAILLREDNGTDVSDLLNGLLADWVRQHQAQGIATELCIYGGTELNHHERERKIRKKPHSS